MSNTIGTTSISSGVELVNQAITGGTPVPFELSMEYGSLVVGGASVASDDVMSLSGGGYNAVASTSGGIWQISASISARVSTSSSRDSDTISLEIGYDEGSNTKRHILRSLGTKSASGNDYDIEMSFNQISQMTGTMQLSSVLKYDSFGGNLSNLTIKVYHWNISAIRLA
jgi:hypothetical protein